ncbi:hypothetical protein ACTXT7_005234 [Hymenolepis weldensis]
MDNDKPIIIYISLELRKKLYSFVKLRNRCTVATAQYIRMIKLYSRLIVKKFNLKNTACQRDDIFHRR